MSSSSNASSDPPQRASLASELDAAFEQDADVQQTNAAFLVGLMGNNAGKLYRIPRGESVLGRSSRAFLTLLDKGVSHQHARLTLDGKGCTITDLESTNGTRVNDVRITGAQQLLAGDVIRLGQATLGFLTDAEDEQQHTRALARVTQPHQGLLSNMQTDPSGAMVTATPGVPNVIHSPAPPPIPVERGVIPAPPSPYLSMGPPEKTAKEKLDDLLDKVSLISKFVSRYGWLLTFTTLGFATLFAATVALSPPYATAEFEVFLRDDPVARGRNAAGPQQVGFFEFAEKDFANLDLVKDTFKEMGMEAPPEKVRQTAESLRLEQLSRVMPFYTGRFEHPNKDFARKFLSAHLKNFLEYAISEAIGNKLDNVRLLQQQYKENHDRLLAAEEQLRDFKKENLDALPEQAAQELGSKATLLTQRDLLTGQLARYTSELRLAEQQLNSQSVMAGSVVARSSPYESALSTVRTKIAAAKAKGYAEGHPELQQLRDEEREYQRLKQQAVNTAPTELEKQADTEYRTLKNQVGQLRVAVTSTQKELGLVHNRLAEIAKIATAMPGVEAEVSEKIRQVEVSKRLHDSLFEQLKAKELELELERNNVRARYEVIKPPRASAASPVATAMKRAFIGGVMGFILALFFAGAHWLYRYAKTRNQVVTAPRSSTTALARTEAHGSHPIERID